MAFKTFKKKGQTNTLLAGLASMSILIVIIIIALTLGGQIADTSKSAGSRTVTNTTVTNETINDTSPANIVQLNNKMVTSIVRVQNSSVILEPGNVSFIDANAGTVNVSDPAYQGRVLNITYAYNAIIESLEYNSTQKAVKGLNTFATFIPIVVISIVGITLVLLVGMLLRREG